MTFQPFIIWAAWPQFDFLFLIVKWTFTISFAFSPLMFFSPAGNGEPPYFLAIGEDPFRKIRENLFLKLFVDKQNCFIGEPLVATFKLYSRLQSRSNVIKNPGFYGFSVYDMINVNDQLQSE